MVNSSHFNFSVFARPTKAYVAPRRLARTDPARQFVRDRLDPAPRLPNGNSGAQKVDRR